MQYGTLVEQRDFDAQGCEHRRVFQPDYAGAHDDQVAGYLLQVVYLVGIKYPVAVEDEIVAVRRPGSASDQDVLALQQLRSFVRFDLNGVRINERASPSRVVT